MRCFAQRISNYGHWQASFSTGIALHEPKRLQAQTPIIGALLTPSVEVSSRAKSTPSSLQMGDDGCRGRRPHPLSFRSQPCFPIVREQPRTIGGLGRGSASGVMPLITLCGWPCCGKTSFANGLITFLQSAQEKPVILVNEETLHIRKAEGYQDATAEKQTRGSLKAGVDHALNSRTVVVLDSMNYIKGFRYELYCSAKSESTPSCVVWVEAEAENTKEWNGDREDAYAPELLDDLRSRFEVPDDRNRWDKPLVRCPATVGADESAREEVYRSVLDAITGGQQVVAGMATQPSQHAEADVLYQLDTVTNKIVNTMMDRQSTAVGPGLTVHLPGATKALELTRRVGLPEAKRLKRQFIKQVAGLGSGVASGAAEPSEREKAITDAFVEYLNVNIN